MWFGDATEKEKREEPMLAVVFYMRTTVNLATPLGFFSRMCSLESLEMLESEHRLVTALNVESSLGVLQITQKHIKGRKVGLEAEMGFPVSEAYSLPMNAKSLMGSVMATLVEASRKRVMIDMAFSEPKCVRLARVPQDLLMKMWGAVPGPRVEGLSDFWGEEILSLEKKNSSDFEKESTGGKVLNNAPAAEENDSIHSKMMEYETLLEASG